MTSQLGLLDDDEYDSAAAVRPGGGTSQRGRFESIKKQMKGIRTNCLNIILVYGTSRLGKVLRTCGRCLQANANVIQCFRAFVFWNSFHVDLASWDPILKLYVKTTICMFV